MDARLQREADRRAFLADAIAVLSRSLNYEATLASLARLAVPLIADWCAVDLLEDGALQRLAVAHVDPAKLDFVDEIQRRYPPDLGATTGAPQILRTGQPELVPVITPEMLDSSSADPGYIALIRQLGLHSYIGVPLRRGDTTIGVITLITAESRRVYDEDDLALATSLADRAAVAIENARLYRDLERAHAQSAAERDRLAQLTGNLEEARAQAELANRAKDEFLAMLGHELRNPLAPILTALELMELRAPQLCERERTVIQRQVRHVVRLVDDLLDVSRITRGGVPLHREHLDLADTIHKAIEIASPLLEERNHELITSVPRGLHVDGDPVRLAQVIANLITNAAKYTERGGEIRVSAARDGEQIVVRVKDTGVGIAPEVLPRVFDTFYQSRQAIDRAQGGLGLGLAIARSLVELHGGTVVAASAGSGKGSEFTVRLPALAVAQRPRPAMGTPLAGSLPLRGERILVVDDNADALHMLADALERRGFTTMRAHDAPSALAVAETGHPHLALLDIGLPVMDGYELGRRLRLLPGGERLLLVAVTGYGQASDRERSKEAGFAAHLVKPISLDAVQATIDELTAPARAAAP